METLPCRKELSVPRFWSCSCLLRFISGSATQSTISFRGSPPGEARMQATPLPPSSIPIKNGRPSMRPHISCPITKRSVSRAGRQGYTWQPGTYRARLGAPVVIVTHGLNGCKCDPNALTVAGMLHRNGFNVLLYDMRNHGQSDIDNGRAAIGNKEFQDVLGAWDWLIAEEHFTPARDRPVR